MIKQAHNNGKTMALCILTGRLGTVIYPTCDGFWTIMAITTDIPP